MLHAACRMPYAMLITANTQCLVGRAAITETLLNIIISRTHLHDEPRTLAAHDHDEQCPSPEAYSLSRSAFGVNLDHSLSNPRDSASPDACGGHRAGKQCSNDSCSSSEEGVGKRKLLVCAKGTFYLYQARFSSHWKASGSGSSLGSFPKVPQETNCSQEEPLLLACYQELSPQEHQVECRRTSFRGSGCVSEEGSFPSHEQSASSPSLSHCLRSLRHPSIARSAYPSLFTFLHASFEPHSSFLLTLFPNDHQTLVALLGFTRDDFSMLFEFCLYCFRVQQRTLTVKQVQFSPVHLLCNFELLFAIIHSCQCFYNTSS